MNEVEKFIGYKFKNKKLLSQSLTHKSVDPQTNYEKFEFIGDSIINFYITDWLFKKFNNEKENNLSIRRSQLVSKKNLSYISKKLNLYKSIKIEDNTNISDRIHCDIFESLIGAIYLDSSYSEVKKIMNYISFYFIKTNTIYDFKGALISLFKKGKIKEFFLDTIIYKTEKKIYVSKIVMNGFYFYGFDIRKKNAEMKSAQLAYNFYKKSIL